MYSYTYLKGILLKKKRICQDINSNIEIFALFYYHFPLLREEYTYNILPQRTVVYSAYYYHTTI